MCRSAGMEMGNAYTLNGAETTKLPLEVLLVGLVRESRNDQRLEGVATDVRVFVRFN